MTAEIDGEDPADPSASTLAHFGAEVRLERERRKVTQMQLASEAHCHYTLVQKIETAKRVPTLDFAKVCDRVFNGHGRFQRLWPLVIKYAFPPWFRRYVELEWEATAIRMFHPRLVPGLLQTEEYARTVLRAGRPESLEDLVTARMERQHILNREEPPELWLVLEEFVLRREVGSKETMRAQLERLRALAETPRHVVQIIPSSTYVYANSSCPYGLLSFSEGADVVHVDGFPRGYILAETDDVKAASRAYDLLKATACGPEESALLIDTILKDMYS